jgi:sensor histidine kinase regulating citrate/malate metabolism
MFKESAAKNRIQIWISTDEDKITVTVANNGKPMNETIRKRMFEYSNSSLLGKDGHRGTGCYQAKQLMTENGGDIDLLPAEEEFPVIFKLIFNHSNINDYEK